jgi:hypothetical protein
VLFVAWGEGKLEVLLKWYINLIAVIDDVAASAKNNNLDILLLS